MYNETFVDIMHKSIKREKCELCVKPIYTHDTVLSCNSDGKIYHAKCLGIETDTALELQIQDDWFCPLCVESILPINLCSADTAGVAVTCICCEKIISPKNHKISKCVLCNKTGHYKCLTASNRPQCCKCCLNLINLNITDMYDLKNASTLNKIFNHVSFNPYNVPEDNEKNRFFDDEIDDYNETLQYANNTLSKCKYFDVTSLTTDVDFKGTSFLFNNIDGFHSNFDEFLNQTRCINNTFDFLCFNETNLKDGMNHDFTINGYNAEFLYSIEGKAKGSGLAIFYKSNLKFNVSKALSFRNIYFECLGGTLKTDIGNVYVLVIYRYSSNTNVREGITELQSLLEKVADQPTVILGDFNINTLNHENDSNVQEYINTFICTGFSPLINKPTHFKGSSSTAIDHMWCNVMSDNVSSGILNVSTSAHMPIFGCLPTSTELLFNQNDVNSNMIRIHNINSKTIEKFGKSISLVNANFSNNIVSDPCMANKEKCLEQFNLYYNEVKTAYNDCFLDTVDITSKRNFIDKPWISLGIAKACETKNKLHVDLILARKSGDPNL